jgi:hypothetical protein
MDTCFAALCVKTQRFSAVKPFFTAENRKEDAKYRGVLKY